MIIAKSGAIRKRAKQFTGYGKGVGEENYCHDGKCKIKFMWVILAHQTMYQIHKDMKQCTASNHEEKYIRQKKR